VITGEILEVDSTESPDVEREEELLNCCGDSLLGEEFCNDASVSAAAGESVFFSEVLFLVEAYQNTKP
jgi:hypothetical protein